MLHPLSTESGNRLFSEIRSIMCGESVFVSTRPQDWGLSTSAIAVADQAALDFNRSMSLAVNGLSANVVGNFADPVHALLFLERRLQPARELHRGIGGMGVQPQLMLCGAAATIADAFKGRESGMAIADMPSLNGKLLFAEIQFQLCFSLKDGENTRNFIEKAKFEKLLAVNFDTDPAPKSVVSTLKDGSNALRLVATRRDFVDFRDFNSGNFSLDTLEGKLSESSAILKFAIANSFAVVNVKGETVPASAVGLPEGRRFGSIYFNIDRVLDSPMQHMRPYEASLLSREAILASRQHMETLDNERALAGVAKRRDAGVER